MNLDLVNKGIPLFPLNFYKCNYFPEIYIKLEELENINNIILPNRLEFIKKYYKFIYFDNEYDTCVKFKQMLTYYNLIN